MANPIDEGTTVSHGVLYRGNRENDPDLVAIRLALEKQLRASLGWDVTQWPYVDYDGNEVE